MIGIALLAIPLPYLGKYVSRSSRGCYKPAVIGLSGVKSYNWAPEGFVEGYVWDPAALRYYYPLYELDRWLWHPPLRCADENCPYPIDEVSQQEIFKVYRAWTRPPVAPKG